MQDEAVIDQLRILASQMRRVANEHPDPDIETIRMFRRAVVVYGHKVYVMLTITTVGIRRFYHFSISGREGHPTDIDQSVVDSLLKAFVPNGVSFPSVLGNCIQFLEEIKV
jgi:hypothetical protein